MSSYLIKQVLSFSHISPEELRSLRGCGRGGGQSGVGGHSELCYKHCRPATCELFGVTLQTAGGEVDTVRCWRVEDWLGRTEEEGLTVSDRWQVPGDCGLIVGNVWGDETLDFLRPRRVRGREGGGAGEVGRSLAWQELRPGGRAMSSQHFWAAQTEMVEGVNVPVIKMVSSLTNRLWFVWEIFMINVRKLQGN